ncbi:ABC transporter substrate-binding protein [Metarhizobium album]|uniref:ABC transporter substrate-binding protein n=1 Tax=Metarhizobium album TaxID=2182425 RepID=A0A2U2DHD0_9HYPH|nr:transporter substrate-binding domain-containing protein [Rhizobium album]PWE52651.1 ABC transporter substrate-binding protein [Rhizobium album]
MRHMVLTALLCLASEAQAAEISFTTEEYPPYSYRQGDRYFGIGVEQIQAMMKDAGLQYDMEMMPWARAYATAQTQSRHCVFAAAHIAERDGLFKWVEPLLIDRNILVSRQGADIKVTNLEDARQYTIGTQRGDYTADLLKEKGFAKVDLAADFSLTLKKLLSERIELMPMSQNVYTELRKQGTPIEEVMVFSEQKLGIACHKDVDDATIDKMQKALDMLIADGRQDKIFIKYGMQPSR